MLCGGVGIATGTDNQRAERLIFSDACWRHRIEKFGFRLGPSPTAVAKRFGYDDQLYNDLAPTASIQPLCARGSQLGTRLDAGFAA